MSAPARIEVRDDAAALATTVAGELLRTLAEVQAGGRVPQVVLTGGTIVATCPGCGYSYDERRGDAREGFPAGTPFASIPDSWCCPDCGVREKVDFLVSHAE